MGIVGKHSLFNNTSEYAGFCYIPPESLLNQWMLIVSSSLSKYHHPWQVFYLLSRAHRKSHSLPGHRRSAIVPRSSSWILLVDVCSVRRNGTSDCVDNIPSRRQRSEICRTLLVRICNSIDRRYHYGWIGVWVWARVWSRNQDMFSLPGNVLQSCMRSSLWNGSTYWSNLHVWLAKPKFYWGWLSALVTKTKTLYHDSIPGEWGSSL